MQLRYIGLVMGIVAVLLISGCTQGGVQISFECGQMSLGWLSEFAGKYYIIPDEAIQCDAGEGSFIMLTLDSEFAGDVAGMMRDNIIEAGIASDSDYYEEICSTSKSFCARNLVVYDGRINTVERIGDEKVAMIVVKSTNPEDVEAFLEGVWQNREPAVS